MSAIASVSENELKNRRQKLRQQRRQRSVRAIWRTAMVSGIAGGLVWVTTLPNWVIRKPEQIDIEGNQFLSAPVIREWMSLSYPQSLFRVQPQALAHQLEAKAPIAEATVTRQLVPPKLMIQVKERQPVAIAVNDGGGLLFETLRERPTAFNSNPVPMKAKKSAPQTAYIDAQGVLLPETSYQANERSPKLPTLKVIGMSDQYRPYWSQMYQAVSRSPVKVLEIDLQDPANLILKTELGIVHCGPYSFQLPEQLSILDRLRELPDRIKSPGIAYINLRNPKSPSIQLKLTQPAKPSKSNL